MTTYALSQKTNGWHTALLLILVLLTLSPVMAKKKTKLPPLNELYSIHDSIIKEGRTLYLYEKVSWNGTDEYRAKATNKDVMGQFVYKDGDYFNSIFFQKADSTCRFEYRFDTNTLLATTTDSIRKLTPTELAWIAKRDVFMKTVNDYIDSLTILDPSFGTLNAEIIPINEHITRLYLIQGTSKNGIIPMGNDYSFDFNNDNHLVQFRRYHRSFIPINMPEGLEVRSFTHSHLADNPYITPTDICTFLLYGRDIYKMKEFSILSLAYGCTFIFSDEKNMIMTETK